LYVYIIIVLIIDVYIAFAKNVSETVFLKFGVHNFSYVLEWLKLGILKYYAQYSIFPGYIRSIEHPDLYRKHAAL